MKRNMGRLLVALIALSTLAGCHRPGPDAAAAPPAMELKLYRGQPQRMLELSSVLDQSLRSLKGHATYAGEGQLLVYAPKEQQPSIAAAIDQLGQVWSAAHAEPLRVRFWMVESRPGAGADDPALTPLTETLKAWQGSMGAQHFTLLDAVGAVIVGDPPVAGVIDTATQHHYEFLPRRDGKMIDMRFSYQGNDFESMGGFFQLKVDVAVRPGKYLVLAQAPADRPAPGPQSASAATTAAAMAPVATGGDRSASGTGIRLLIMRVDTLSATD